MHPLGQFQWNHDGLLPLPALLPLGLSGTLRWKAASAFQPWGQRFMAPQLFSDRSRGMHKSAVQATLLTGSPARSSDNQRSSDLPRSDGLSAVPRCRLAWLSANRTANRITQRTTSPLQLQCTRSVLYYHGHSRCAALYQHLSPV